MEIDKCPCFNCLCLPVCKHKTYYDLKECSLVVEYIYVDRILYNNEESIIHLLKVIKVFGEPEWKGGLLEFLEIDENDYHEDYFDI